MTSRKSRTLNYILKHIYALYFYQHKISVETIWGINRYSTLLSITIQYKNSTSFKHQIRGIHVISLPNYAQ